MTRNVSLISLPWPRAEHLSIQLGVLAAYLRERGISVIQKNYARELPAIIGIEQYRLMLQNELQGYEAATILFPSKRRSIKKLFKSVIGTDNDFRKYIADCIKYYRLTHNDLLLTNSFIYGFTTSFLQLLPSLLVSRLLKNSKPDCLIVFGGAGITKEFGVAILEHFSWVDIAVFGEGEETLLDIYNATNQDANFDLSKVDGIVYRDNFRCIKSNTPRRRLENLDTLPTPDFSGQEHQWISEAESINLMPTITIEGSRGCFYGKCTFCNLNMQWDNSARKKTDEKIIDEITKILKQQDSFRIFMCDTNVSDRKSFFEKLAKKHSDLDIFVEVSGHKDGRDFEFYQTLRRAGVSQIQIGIEALSTSLLKKIRKGTTAIENIQLLKWCAVAGIRVYYNIMYLIPGESQEEIEGTALAIEFAMHYEPPGKLCRYIYSHNSPAMENPSLFSIKGGELPSEIKRIFNDEWAKKLAPLLTPIVGLIPDPTAPYGDWNHVKYKIDAWRKLFDSNSKMPSVYYRDMGQHLVIETLSGEDSDYITLSEPYRSIILMCDMSIRKIDSVLTSISGPTDFIQSAIDDLFEARLLFKENGRLLSIPIKRDVGRHGYIRSSAF
ncbi:radical SAM protein [Pseudomonas sp. NPDC087817]|uniref:radical SAM protein n=1 Tax=Pseudomonas sp. NPDC087817 TaxID=3364451 RepID=UPI003816BFBC